MTDEVLVFDRPFDHESIRIHMGSKNPPFETLVSCNVCNAQLGNYFVAQTDTTSAMRFHIQTSALVLQESIKSEAN
jgi:peptide methionine sulfoxide reductase MsrB